MDPRTLAVVDGNSLIHRAFHGLPPTMTAPDGRPTNAVFGFTSMLLKMIAEFSPEAVVVAFDLGKPAFRTEALAAYKIHRPPTDPLLKAQFSTTKDVLRALDIPIVEVEGWEGDDILGTLAEKGKDAGMRVLLVTGDKDALQLVDDSVSVVSTKKGITDIVIYDTAAVVERYGVTPEQVIDFLGLKGDTSDNIPGVPGVGEKTAAKLLAEYHTLDAVLENAAGIKGKLGERLREHADSARASRVVATIRRDVPVDIDLDAVEWGSFDRDTAVAKLAELSFTSLIGRLLDLAVPAKGAASAQAPTKVRILEGVEADAWVRALVASPPGEWVGVALGVSTECLFADERELGVAYDDVAARVMGAVADEALAALLSSGRIASADIKALLESPCPPGSVRVREGSGTDVADPERLFDCGVAAYVLASNRSSYDLSSVSADHLGKHLAEDADTATQALACAGLAVELEAELASTDALSCFRRCEMDLIPVLVRMEEVGVGVDREVLAGLATETGGKINALITEIHGLAGTDVNIDSPKQLAEVLFDKLGLPPGKRTKTGYSTDSSVLSGLAESYPIAARILEYRELAKLKSTYIDALPRLVGEDGRLHTTFNQTVAATGRLSSSSPNLQNIPVRTELGRRIRAAFVPAEEGDLIVSADYSQIELRVLAHLSQDAGLIEAFTSGADFHEATAARVFGGERHEVTPEMRRRAKAVNFGIVYGISAHGLSQSLGVVHAEAQGMIDRYFAAYPGVRTYLDETVAAAHRDGYAVTLYGRRRPIPELRSSNWNMRSFGERTAMNHPMQGTAADIMKLAMVEVDRRLRAEGFRARMVLQVHDELVFEAPADEYERLSEMAREAMAGVVELAVPLLVDVGAGTDWASAK
jgi:DNA polymerase-1